MPFDNINVYLIFSLPAVILCAATGSLALVRNIRSPAYRAFAIGMAVLIAETVLSYFNLNALLPSEAVRWSKWRMAATALLPGSWLLFSLSYARRNFDEFGRTWKWVVLRSFAIPVLSVFMGWDYLFSGHAGVARDGSSIIPVGWSGYCFYISLLLCSVLILADIQKTLRTSYGAVRRQIKFSILGVGILFVTRVFTSAQILLFWTQRTDVFTFEQHHPCCGRYTDHQFPQSATDCGMLKFMFPAMFYKALSLSS